MSDRPIQAGDLVQVVRGCVPSAGGALGAVFKVASLFNRYINPCCFCRGVHEGVWARATERFGDDNACAPAAWLKRIPPLSELEGQRAEEDIKEPA